MKSLFLVLALLLPSLSQGRTLKPISIAGFDLVSRTDLQLHSAEQKIRVFLFLNPECPCSRSHLPHLMQLSQEFSDMSFLGLHSNPQMSRNEATEYFSKLSRFPVIDDPQLKYANHFAALKTPHAFVLNSKEEVLFEGGVSDSSLIEKSKKFFLRDALLAIRQGKEVPKKIVRALGCSIQR